MIATPQAVFELQARKVRARQEPESNKTDTVREITLHCADQTGFSPGFSCCQSKEGTNNIQSMGLAVTQQN